MKRATFITWEQLRVGVVILISLAILTLAVYKLGQAANLFTSRYTLIAFLDNANGVRVGGSVAVAGQVAGTIREIEFLPPDADTTRNLRVELEIDETLREQIRGDSRARVRTMGLLGDKQVDINPGTPRYAVLEEGDTIAVDPSLDYEEVIAQASEAVDDMVQLTADLKLITGGIVRGEGTLGQLVTNPTLYDEMSRTLSQANALLARLSRSEGTFGRIIDDPTLYVQMTSAIGQLDSLLVKVTKAEGTFGRMLADTTLYTNLVGITQGADSLMTMLTQGNGFANKMLTDQQLYDRLNKLVTDLGAIAEDIRRDPRRYFRGLINFP
jgi:phospholipid/cholesterol/gamma-HCH transport system substrate-binding protein